MKQIALIVLSLCPALTGQYLSHLLRKRVESLEKVELMLSLIEANISFFSTPSAELIQILIGKAELSSLGFLNNCYERLQMGENFRDAWMNSISIRKNTGFLNSNDIALLRMFCENFGTSDKNGEISNCRFCNSLLKEHILQARQNKEKYGSILSGLGFFIGAALIIVLY